MNKILKYFLFILFIAISLTFDVYAEDVTYTEGPFKYIINEDNCITIIEYFGEGDVVNVPRSIGFYNKDGETLPYMVTRIASGAFVESDIENVVIPDTVLFIEEGAFNENTNIEYYYGTDFIPDNTRDPQTIIVEPDNKDEDPGSYVVDEEENEAIIVEEVSIGEDPLTGEIEEVWNIDNEDVDQDINTEINNSNNYKPYTNNSNYLIFLGLVSLTGIVIYFYKKINKKQ